MTQIDTTQFPDELRDIEIRTEMPQRDGLMHQLRQQAAPFPLHGEHLLPHRAVHVIEFEQGSRHRAAARQARPRGPPEPVLDEGLETWQPFSGPHRWSDDLLSRAV